LKPLSFIIITYNRPEDALALLENIYQLDNATDLLEEIIIVNNASTSDYSKVENFIESHTGLPYYYFHADENLGVAKGRNFALQKSTSPILIMLDDDAELQNSDSLIRILEEFEKKNTTRPKAIISFKVLYYETRQMQVNAFPHKQFNIYKDRDFLETYYYAGGAHAIKRSVLEEVGTYPEDFFYGMEEYDLSYRVLNAGYSIVYSNKIVMLHKESPLGRKPKEEKLRMMWVNKTKVCWRYLPLKYLASTAFLWSFFYLKNAGLQFKGWMQAWKDISEITKSKRYPINNETLKYLKTLKARLWY
jgi:GT2 family glycosyltransferase